MKKYNMTTPEGTKDVLFEECIAKRDYEKKIKDIFSSRAYNEVISPGIEYFDVFNLGEAAIAQSEMFISSDNKGRLLAFRPDLTLPIARMASTRLKNHRLPLRMFYNQNVYRNRNLNGGSNEYTQAGVELIGVEGLSADLEVITMAVETIKASELDFRFEIGNAKVFKYLAGKLGVDEDKKEIIRSVIESKNYAVLKDILSEIEPSIYTKAIENLPRLFGTSEVFEQALEFCQDEEYVQTLDYLKSVYSSLEKLGIAEHIFVDLGLVQKNEYYTGIVFSAYVQEHGMAVLTGGRYDNLLEKFASASPAVGFAVEVDVVANILADNQNVKIADVLVFAEKGFEIDAQLTIGELTKNGFVCETSFQNNILDAEKYAAEKGIAKVVVVNSCEREAVL